MFFKRCIDMYIVGLINSNLVPNWATKPIMLSKPSNAIKPGC